MTGSADARDEAMGSRQLQDRAVEGAVWTMVHTVIAIPIAFAVNLLLARVLAPDGYGRLAFLTTTITILGSLIALGLSSAMIQFGAKAHSRGDEDEVRRILSASQGFRLIIVAPLLTVVIVWLVDVPVGLLALAIAFGVWFPAAFDGGPITLFIENKSAAGARIAMVSNLIVQVGVVVSVLWVGTADSVWATRIVLVAFGITLALLAIRPDYRRAVLRPRLPRGFPAGFWRFALPTGAASLVADLALSRTEVLYLTWWSTPHSVGLFALAFGVAGHVFAPAQALTGPLLPAIAGLREVDPDRVADAFARTLRTASTIVGLLSAAALPALVVLVPLLYGQEFAEAAPAVLALGVVGALMVLAGPVSTFVLARLSARTLLAASLWALAVNLACAVSLIPLLGLWGAVVSNAAGSLTQLALLVRSERRDLGVPLGRLIHEVLPVLLGGGACVLAWGITTTVSLRVLPSAALASTVAVVVLLLGMRLTRAGVRAEDAAALLRVAPRRLHPLARRLIRVVTIDGR